MAKDLTVLLEDRPGTLAALGEALGKARINVEGVCGVPSEGRATVHILVEDAAAARRALQQAGITVRSERDVLVQKIEDKPGALGSMARKLADAGVNIDLVYLATNTRVVLGVGDMEKARKAL